MQNTLPLTVGNPLRNIQGLARQISLPGEHAPQRFPSFPALERTAVMGFNQPTTLPCAAGEVTELTLFRQAAWPAWATWREKIALAYSQFFTAVSGDKINSWEFADNFSPVPNRLSSPSKIGVAGGYNPLSFSVIGADETMGTRTAFVYCPNGLITYVGLTVPGVQVVLEYSRWTKPNEYESGTRSFTMAADKYLDGTVVSSAPGWYRLNRMSLIKDVDFTVSAIDVLLISANVAATITDAGTPMGSILLSPEYVNPVVYPIIEPVEYKNSALPWESTRLTAVGLLATNVTQVLNKGGTILAGRVNPETQNAWTVTEAYVNGLHPAEKSFLPMETGLYTYCPPSTDMADFYDYTGFLGPRFRLDNAALYNKVYIRVPTTSSLAVTVSWHIEFRTSSALFQIGLSGMTIESLHQAQLVLAETGFFFENPEHNKIISKVIGLSKKYAPAALGMVHPLLGKMAEHAVKNIKPPQGKTRVQATSLQGSGALGQPKKKPKEQEKQQKKKK